MWHAICQTWKHTLGSHNSSMIMSIWDHQQTSTITPYNPFSRQYIKLLQANRKEYKSYTPNAYMPGGWVKQCLYFRVQWKPDPSRQQTVKLLLDFQKGTYYRFELCSPCEFASWVLDHTAHLLLSITHNLATFITALVNAYNSTSLAG